MCFLEIAEFPRDDDEGVLHHILSRRKIGQHRVGVGRQRLLAGQRRFQNSISFLNIAHRL